MLGGDVMSLKGAAIIGVFYATALLVVVWLCTTM